MPIVFATQPVFLKLLLFGFNRKMQQRAWFFPSKFVVSKVKWTSGTETIYSGIDNGKDLEMAFWYDPWEIKKKLNNLSAAINMIRK